MSNADRRAALQAARAAGLAALLDELLVLDGDERALDVGAGTGAFAFALAPRVREVVAIERDEELAARALADAPANVEVLVGDGERRRVIGTVSMDAVAVELGSDLSAGTSVVIVGDGVLLEEHARVAGTITYELACGLDRAPERTRREVIG